jgi:phage terminase large subunit GpA-like protein
MYAESRLIIENALAKAFRPRLHLSVSEWSDANIILSSKESPEPGPWRTERSPLLREPMDCMSSRSTVRQMVLMWPIQFGKTMVLRHGIGYAMSETPGPVMLCLPSEVARDKVVDQKINPMLDSTECIKEILVTGNSRDSANRRFFKDFHGGQLFIEHAGAPGRLKSASVKYVFVDELTDFANSLNSGDDPIQLLEGRTSAFPANSRIVYISTPGVEGQCRTTQLFNLSDKRRFHVPCPHCLTEQPLVWSGFHWDKTNGNAWYVCNDCGSVIDEREKTDMMAAGRWIAENPMSQIRGYTANCLYYPIGLGPRWQTLAKMWLDAQDNPATLKTFINDRLAEPFEDPTMRQLKLNIIAERAEPYALRVAPRGVCAVTAGVDTQDNRLEVHVTGWGKGMASWTLDYNVLWGDPADEAVWIALADYLNATIDREDGHVLSVLATAIDAGGHRTEAVKDFVRRRLIKRPMAIFGAVSNNAPILSRPKAQDITWRGRTDKNGVHIYHVGTVGIKHKLFGNLSVDSDKPVESRNVHFSEQLPPEYFSGIVSETYDPRANRFIKKRGARNEPLDTWVYSYAAAHHPELRLHLLSAARWAELGAAPMAEKQKASEPARQSADENKPKAIEKNTNSFASDTWGSRL